MCLLTLRKRCERSETVWWANCALLEPSFQDMVVVREVEDEGLQRPAEEEEGMRDERRRGDRGVDESRVLTCLFFLLSHPPRPSTSIRPLRVPLAHSRLPHSAEIFITRLSCCSCMNCVLSTTGSLSLRGSYLSSSSLTGTTTLRLPSARPLLPPNPTQSMRTHSSFFLSLCSRTLASLALRGASIAPHSIRSRGNA